MTTRLRAAAAVSLVACLALSSCSGDDKDGTSGEKTPSPSPSSTLPGGVTLTKAGTELSFGETGTAEYAPTQSLKSILSFTVDKAVQGSIDDLKGFSLDTDYKKNASYYYVDVTVANVGDGDLSGRDVPLYGVDGQNRLLPPVAFNSAFKKCPTKKLPADFVQGKSFSTCLVFLSEDHGPLTAVSFNLSPTESITWTGTVGPPEPTKKPGKKNKKKDG